MSGSGPLVDHRTPQGSAPCGQLGDGSASAPPTGARPVVQRSPGDPRRSRDDHNPVPYQVALAAQDVLDAILGDEPFDLADVAPMLGRLAEFTDEGHPPFRLVWTKARVHARVVELIDLYNPPPELGGDIPPTSERGVEELAGAR